MIQIDDRFGIKADEKQFTLVEKVTREKKDSGDSYDGEKTHGHYVTLSQAFTALYRLLQREKVREVDMTLQEAMELFSRLDTLLRETFRKIDTLEETAP